MKFYGKGLVWDPGKNKLLCRFVRGELNTTDKYVIEKLIERGYKHDEELTHEEITIEQLRELGKEKGLKGFSMMKRETLIERLGL